jgi:hypothetical protein
MVLGAAVSTHWFERSRRAQACGPLMAEPTGSETFMQKELG